MSVINRSAFRSSAWLSSGDLRIAIDRAFSTIRISREPPSQKPSIQ